MGLIAFTPDHLSGLSAWYKVDSLIQQKEPQEISGLQMWFRASDLAKQKTPDQISGLTAWYRADQGVTQVGGIVSGWTDITGEATHNLSQSNASNKPSFTSANASFNNQPTISFGLVSGSAANTWLQSSTWTSALAQPATIIAIVKQTAADPSNDRLLLDGIDATNRMSLLTTAVSSSQYTQYAGTSVLTGVANNQTPVFLVGTFNGASSNIYQSSNLACESGNSPGATGIAGLTVGSRFGGNIIGTDYWNGDIAEVIIFNRALTQTEIQELAAYASARYGITIQVGLWADNNGSGNNASQSTQTNQPNLVLSDAAYNNQPLIQSTGAGPYLAVGPFTAISNTVTIFAVGQTSNALIFGINGGTNQVYVDLGATGWRLGNDTTNIVSTNPANTPSILTAIANGGSSSLWVDAITSTLAGSIGTQALDRFGILGANTGTGTGAAKIAELAIFNRVLTQAEIQALHIYATNKYGITLSIGQWLDSSQSGDSNKIATQTTQSKQPTLTFSSTNYNKKPLLNFLSSASQTFHTGTWAAALTSPYTIVLVGNDDGSSVAGQEAYFDNEKTGPEAVLRNLSGTYNLYQGGSAITAGVAASASPNVFVSVFNSASSGLYISSRSSNGGSGSLTSVNLTGLTIGGLYDDSATLNGTIAEIIVYNKALSPTEIAKIEGYCGNKYKIWINN